MTAPPGTVRVLWNPAAGRGRGARHIAGILEAFARHGVGDHRATQAPGDETRVVHEAIADGIETIVVAGGDGTWSKCAVALARAGSPARMAFIAAGTGNDFGKNLRVDTHDVRAVAALVASGGVVRRVDLGRVEDNWFLNVAGFGFDATVLAASNRIRAIGGPAVYVYAALRELRRYEGFEARLAGAGNADDGWARRLLVVFSNGRAFGGAFRIAPPARIDDGLLDAIVCGDTSWTARLPLLLRALRGTHLTHPQVQHATNASFTLELHSSAAYELDGELMRTTGTTVTVAVVPGALRVLDAPG